MKKSLLLLLFFLPIAVFALNNSQPNTPLLQVGTFVSALSGAVYGDINFATVSKHGNFGLGTVNGIQGEFVALNGQFLIFDNQGKTSTIPLTTKTPYIEVIKFNPKMNFKINNIKNYTQLRKFIRQHLNNRNIPYAIAVKGDFEKLLMRGRSPRKAYQKAQKEHTYSADNQKGTLIGFYFPNYLLSLTAPGFHFHFLSNSQKFAGHVLNVSIKSAIVYLQPIQNVKLYFPNTKSYRKTIIMTPSLESYKKAQA